MCEESPRDAIQTNIVGTQHVIDAALSRGVRRVIFTSSDKAVNPTSVMGTSKLMGERLMTAASATGRSDGTIFASTRFGNVLGSRGSVIPLFHRQIAAGGPVTLTDLGMSRFIMSLAEAVRLVIESMFLATGGEVFVTKMPVVRIADLASVMIEELAAVHGFEPGQMQTRVIGVKAGEKMYEELLNEEEVRRTLELERYYVVKPALATVRSQPCGRLSGRDQATPLSTVRTPVIHDGTDGARDVAPFSSGARDCRTRTDARRADTMPARVPPFIYSHATLMRILILGGDGYLGWPTAMHFAARGHEVTVVDNYLRRTIAMQTHSQALLPNPDLVERCKIFESVTGKGIKLVIADAADQRVLATVVRDLQPEAAVHYAEQPSAPYSMMGFDEAKLTLENNLGTTFSLIWAVLSHAPDCHIIKLGTMGEYGTPNIDIEEGWIDIEHKGRKDRFLFPRQAGSLYHTTKVLDTDLLWFYVRANGIRATDLMQGPVYGLSTPEADADPRLAPNFHYDDIFGTVLNRFLVQAVAGTPLTVYGKGEQVRGYLNLNDTLQCVELAATQPAARGELRILNQFTETFSGE